MPPWEHAVLVSRRGCRLAAWTPAIGRIQPGFQPAFQQCCARTCSSGMHSVLAPMASLVALRRFTSSSLSSVSHLRGCG